MRSVSANQGGIHSGQAARIEPAGGVDDLVQARPPRAVPQRAERVQHARGLLGGLGRGHDRHPVRPDRPQRPEVEIRSAIASRAGAGLASASAASAVGAVGAGIGREDQVVVGQLEQARAPGGDGLQRLLLELGRARRPGDVPHGPPALGHRRQRVGRYQRVG